MNRDRYPFLGDRKLVKNFEAALEAVRAVYPDAIVEGSTGAERSFERSSFGGRELVAHCWPRRRGEDAMYLRLLSPDRPGVLL